MSRTQEALNAFEMQIEDDIAVIRIVGEYTIEMVAQSARLRDEQSARFGYRLALVDVTHGRTISAETRRAIVEDGRKRRVPESIAIVGTSFTTRTIASMVMKAIVLLTKKQSRTEFFADELAARAWLAQERVRIKQILAEQPKS